MQNVQNLKVPRLAKNRHGVFYVRASALDGSGRRKVQQTSLHTKDPLKARILALHFCLNLTESEWMKKTGILADLVDLETRQLKQYPDGSFEYDPSKSEEIKEADRIRDLQATKQMKPVFSLPAIQDRQHFVYTEDEKNRIRESEAKQKEYLATLDPYRYTGGSITPTQGETLKEALNQHLAEEERQDLDHKTISDKRKVYADFLGFHGDIPLNDITKNFISSQNGWRSNEFDQPNSKNPEKKRGGVTLEKRHGYLSKFFVWANESGKYHHENPLKQKMVPKSQIKANTQSWEEFTDGDIAALFNANNYVAQMTEPDWYWLPLCALFSGARISEIAKAELSSFEIIGGIKCYRVINAKTIDSKRTIPIHSKLLELGFWDYAEYLKSEGEVFITPHRVHDPVGTPKKERTKKPQDSTGDKWGAYVDFCGIKNRLKSFHSFRSTAITDLHNANAPHSAIKRGLGHTTEGMKGVHGQYVRGIELENIQKAIELLEHPQVDFKKLRLEDPTFKAFFDKLKVSKNTAKGKAKAESKAKNEKAKAARNEINRDKRKKGVER